MQKANNQSLYAQVVIDAEHVKQNATAIVHVPTAQANI